MGTKVQWTNETWNPIVGCSKVSPGCANCYAEKMAERLAHMGTMPQYEHVLKHLYSDGWNGKTAFVESALSKPLHWRKPRKIFVCSMGDLFHESVPFEWIDKVFAVMALCPQHTFQVLTKRAERMKEYFQCRPAWDFHKSAQSISDNVFGIACKAAAMIENGDDWELHQWPLENVWLGVTAENAKDGYPRIELLKRIPAALRFLSLEPLLEGITLTEDTLKKIDWVIVGAESGASMRFCDPQLAMDVVMQCQAAGVPCFVKQIHNIGCRKCGFDACTHLAGHRPKTFLIKEPAGWPREFPV